MLEDESDVDRGLIVIPSISSGPFGSPFDEVVEDVSNNRLVVRIDAWERAEDLEEMSLQDLHDMIGKACELLEGNGCESIDVVGKSFGGMLALTYANNNIFVKWFSGLQL